MVTVRSEVCTTLLLIYGFVSPVLTMGNKETVIGIYFEGRQTSPLLGLGPTLLPLSVKTDKKPNLRPDGTVYDVKLEAIFFVEVENYVVDCYVSFLFYPTLL